MVAKGLDYPAVTLVGVLDADTGLHLPEFRAGERTFQLLSQVAGRAGRGETPGRVIIQTYWPDHPAVRGAAQHQRSIFTDAELPVRRELGYPPYARLSRILVTGRRADDVRHHAGDVARTLEETVPEDHSVLGPSEAVISRIKGTYRYQVLLFSPRGSEPGPILSSAIASPRAPEGVSVAPDVDAYDLM
jgi:primosomal protein N' (replication factor Y)